MAVRGVLIDLGVRSEAGAEAVHVARAITEVDPAPAIGIVTRGTPVGEFALASFVLPVHLLGLPETDPRLLAMAAAAAQCRLRDLVLVAVEHSTLLSAADAIGCRTICIASREIARLDYGDGIAAAISEMIEADDLAAAQIGAPPHAEPWPTDPRLDPELLRSGDRRNVVDRFRYWREDAIISELDSIRTPVHVAVENWQHDLNIGTVVRNANAFNVSGVHIVGKRRWNRRGAMATDRYLDLEHHPCVDAFASWAQERSVPMVGIDNIAGAVALEAAPLPSPCVLVFGQEGPGLSEAMAAACSEVREITQHGSTRSLNAGVASGIALHWWVQHRR